MNDEKVFDDELFDLDLISIDKEFFYFLLSCLIAQKNINKLSHEKRDMAQEAIDKAFDDGISFLRGIDFVPKSDTLFRKTVIKLGEQFLNEYFGVRYDGRKT